MWFGTIKRLKKRIKELESELRMERHMKHIHERNIIAAANTKDKEFLQDIAKLVIKGIVNGTK